MSPTDEQLRAIDAFVGGSSYVLTAGAGTGKTTTLKLLANSSPTRRGIYVAFNRAIAQEARAKFPPNVTIKTTHALAYHGTDQLFQRRLSDPRIPNDVVADRLGITGPYNLGPGRVIRRTMQASLAVQTVRRFCSSADERLRIHHVPIGLGLGTIEHAVLARRILPLAQKVWDDLSNPNGDQFRFEHDVYQKVWALSSPTWGYDFVLFDEAQDATPVVSSMVRDQLDRGSQLVAVGDEAQSIYGWRGVENAMRSFGIALHLPLTQSFRFGPRIAEEANKWLDLIGAPLRLSGNKNLTSRIVTSVSRPDAILCRTNAGVIGRLIGALQGGTRAAVVGGGQDVHALAKAAQQLKAGIPTDHSELFLFPTWRAVQDYVEEGDAPDLKALVKLIDSQGAAEIEKALNQVVDESSASLVLSTVHKAKGREWNRVALHNDFAEPSLAGGTSKDPVKDELMLSYVAVTRAKIELSRGNLSWIDRRPESATNFPVSPQLVDEPDDQTSTIGKQDSPEPLVGASNVPEHVQKARAEHSNAYARWTEPDDDALLNRYRHGLRLSELVGEFGRSEGAIRSRVARLLKVDYATKCFDSAGQPLLVDYPS